MKGLFSTLGILFLASTSLFSQTKVWKVTDGKMYFKSETEIETIYGEGGRITGTLDLSTKKILIEISLFDLKTPNKLQTSHMHDNYLETPLFPIAKFEGTVDSIKESGEVKAKGVLDIHGKKKDNFVITGNLEKKEDTFEQLSYFTVVLPEFGIQIPSLVFLKLNKNIQVKVKLIWKPE